ncbi:MAG TPA: protoporphyrinogen oxidase HemJ [Alphaproteobacteria bacterium]|mgnify:CR=1 FL=1|nr:protoporphyrinogen oxidase HemJ [Rhodospirillaceae bacterium]HRJ66128.1 protoporphyrinogen oxidase HemJ [Alphaproteobacteria bacterium]
MHDFIATHYLWFKALHLMALISWMAGIFYLPRLYVYHAEAEKGSELSETFKIMERKLLKVIMNPAMIATWVLGLLMLHANPEIMTGQGWMHAKLTLVLCMSGFHGYLAYTRKVFLRDENKKSHKFYRKINEIPTFLMMAIVILAVVKPF